MGKGFFNMEAPVWHWIGKVPEMLGLSILWFVLSIPVLTMPAATSALYDACARALRPDEKGVFKRFFSTFGKEIKRSLLLGLLWGVLVVILSIGNQILLTAAETDSTMAIFGVVYQISFLMPLAVFMWLNILESRFFYSFWGLHKGAIIFVIGYLPYTALMVVILVVGVVACFFVPMLTVLMPALIALLQSLPAEKVLKKHMPKEEGEE